MEITVYQRIKAYIDDNRISLNALAKTLNMNQSTVLRQVKGEQTLSSTLVENFLKAYPDVSAEYSCLSVLQVENPLSLDDIRTSHCLSILRPGLRSISANLWDEV